MKPPCYSLIVGARSCARPGSTLLTNVFVLSCHSSIWREPPEREPLVQAVSSLILPNIKLKARAIRADNWCKICGVEWRSNYRATPGKISDRHSTPDNQTPTFIAINRSNHQRLDFKELLTTRESHAMIINVVENTNAGVAQW
jgi:hypothetical protein